MDAEEKKLQNYVDWRPKRLSSEEERALLDGIRHRNDERKRAMGVLPRKIEDVKKQMDGMLPASDPETVNLMPGYFRERTPEEQAEYDQYQADKADFDSWTKTSPIAKKRLDFAKRADYNQLGRDKIQNELIETWRAEKGLRSFADMNNLDALQGKIDMLKRRASEKSGVPDKAKFSDFRPTQFGGITSVHDVGEKQELGIIGKAESLYNDLGDIVSYAKEFKKRGGYGSSAGEFWKGFKDALSKLRTIDLGITDLFESNAFKEIVRKAQGGGELTDQEKAVLELDQLYKEVSAAFNPSRSYKGGYNTGASLPFMAEFAFSPVSGAGKAVAKAVGKSLVAKGAKEGAKGLSKFAARVVSSKGGELALRTMADVFVTAPAMTATTGLPRVLAEANRRMIEDGDTPLSATLKAGTASWIEYMSEGLGGAVDVGLSKAGRLMFGNGMEKLAATAVGRKLSALSKSSYAGAVRRMKGAANVQGFLSENIEEHIGNIVNYFTVGDVAKEDLLNLDTYLDTAIPIAVMQAVFGIASVGGYSLQVGRVSRVAKKAETALGQFMPPEEQAKLRERMESMPLDAVTGLIKRQIQKAVENERQAAQTEDESLAAVYMQDAKKARAAAAYVYAHTQKGVLIGAKRQVDEEKEQAFTQERDKIKADYIASMPAAENGSYRIVRLNGEGGEAVQVMTDVSTYEVEERGDMITRFRAPGNAVFVMHDDGTKEQVRVDQLLFDKELPWVDNVDETATNLANMDASKFFEELEAEREAEFESAQVETEKEGLRIENGEMAMMSQEDGSLVPVTIADTSMIDDGMVGIVMQDDSMGVVPVESLSAYEAPEESRQSEPQPYSEEERALQEEAGVSGMEKSEQAQYDEALAEENADGLSFDDLEAPDAARELRDQIPDADGAIEFVEDEIKSAKKELASIKKSKAKGSTVQERAKSFQERRNRIKEAEARISRLESIRSELANMGMAEMERINNEESILDVEAKTGEELAAMMLMSGTKLIYSDFKRHTGYGDKEARGMFGIFASAEKGGIGIERFGEILMEMDEDGRFFDHDNAMSAVDAILSLFQSVRKRGDLYKFISNNEQARREEEMKKSMSEEEYFIRQAFGMSMDEYSAYLRMFQDKLLTADDYKELEEIIAEEYGKGTGDQGRDSEDTGDGQGRASGSPVSNDELLQGERAGDGSGAVRMEERGGSAGERGGSDGSLQDEVKNGIFAEDGISERISQADSGAQDGESSEVVKEPHFSQGGFESSLRDAQAHKGELSEREIADIAEAYAKDANSWVPLPDQPKLGTPLPSGVESEVYYNELDGFVYKVNNLSLSKNILSFLERINLHNKLFPETQYELIGFSGFGNGSVYPIVRQRFIPNAEFATPEEIDSYMRSLGFEKTSKEAEYSNGEYVVSDLRPRNALKDSDGDIYVVDAGLEAVASVSDQIAEEREKVDPNPTEAQKEAGNYRKGHIKLDGFDVTIEIPKGGVRSGVDANGKEWSIEMPHDYGYIRGTKGKDGDHIDVFLSESPEDGAVFVVDQVKEDGSFDEHKVMYGFSNLEEAKAAYLSNYSAGWKGLGNITEVSKDGFKKWVESSTRKTKPFAEYASVKRELSSNDPVAKKIKDIEDKQREIDELVLRRQDVMSEKSQALKEFDSFAKSNAKLFKDLSVQKFRAHRISAIDDIGGESYSKDDVDTLYTSFADSVKGKNLVLVPSDSMASVFVLEDDVEVGSGRISGIRGQFEGEGVGDREVLSLEELSDLFVGSIIYEVESEGIARSMLGLRNKYISLLHESVDIRSRISDLQKGIGVIKNEIEILNKDKEVKRIFDSYIMKHGDVQPAKKTGKPIDSSVIKFAIRGNDNPILTGVYHDNGYAVATDGIILLADKTAYDKSKNGRVDNGKSDSYLEGKFPNWKSVIPEVPLHPIDFNKLLGQLRAVREDLKPSRGKRGVAKSAIDKSVVSLRLPSGEIASFQLARLELSVSAAIRLGFDGVGYERFKLVMGGKNGNLVLVEHRPSTDVSHEDYPVAAIDLSKTVDEIHSDNPDIRFRRSGTPIRESDGEVFARGQGFTEIPDGVASTHFAYEPNLAHIYEDPTAYYELEKLAKENGGILPEGWEYDFSPEDFRLKDGYVCCKQSDNYEYPQYIMGAGDDSFCVFFEGEKVATIYDGVVAKVEKVLDVWERKGNEYVQVDDEDAKSIKHERFRFLGEKGAAALDRYEEASHRMDNLAVAREMEEAGTDEQTIKRATGWERGADGLWRYEVSDFDLEIVDESFDKALGQYGVSLAEFVGKDSSLFVSYPLMKYINVKRRDLGDRINGSFQSVARSGFIEINRSLPIADAEATLVHEVQHAIQHEEGFENGTHSSSSDYRKNAGEVEARNAARRIDFTDDIRVMLGKYTEDVSRADQIFLSDAVAGLRESVDPKRKSITAWDELLRRSPKLQMQQKIREEVGSLSKQLNVPVNFVFSRDLKGKKAQSKGWYDGKTGEIFIVLDKNVDVEDAVATVMHEVVAHKGLRDMLGRAEHDALMDEVFNVIPEDVISELKGFYWDDTKSDAHNRRVLADEYVALLAETYQAPSVIERIAAAVRAAFRKLGISLKMNDGDIMYMLYLSKNRLTNRDSSRTTIDKMDRLQTAKQFANEYDNIMFRMPIEDVENSLYEDYPIEVATYMRAKLSSRWYRWTEAHQDAMRSWKLFIDKLKDVKESENVYMMENLMGSRAADKVSRFEHDKMKPLETSIRKLKKAVKLNDEGFSLYLIAKHAPERNEYMRRKAVEKLERDRSGLLKDMSDEDFRLEVERAMKKDYSGEKAVERELKALGYDSLQAYIDHVENTAGSELINTLWDRLRAATGYSIKEWYDCGMMGKESYNEMKSRYQFYVPLRGHMGEVAKDIFRYYKAEVDPRFSDPNERAEGRKSIADNPLPYIRQMAHSAIIAGSKNLVKMCAYRLASSHKNDVLFIGTQYYEVRKDGDGNIIDYIPIYPDINADDSEEEMREKMMDFHGRTKRGLENGSIVKEAKGAQDMKLFATDQQVKEHICTLKINGRSFYLIAPMHPELTQSITGRNRGFADGAIIRSVAAVTNFMAKNYTSRSPNFMLSNFSRDVWWSLGSLFTREGTGYTMRYVKNIPLAFKEQFKGRKNSVVLDEFYKSGASTGFVTTLKESEYKKSYKNRASTSHWFVAKKMWYGLWESFRVPNVFFENATRLAVFMTSRQEGRSLARSAYDAKEASVNFNRKGSGKMGAAQLKSFFAFYNAGVQGLDAYGKLWGANWRKTLFLHGMAVFLGAAPYIVAALTGDDETRKKYFALPEYVRRNNLVIPLWGDSFLKIPLPIEARAYHALGDVFGGLFRGEISSKQAALATVSSMMDMFPINFFDAHGGIEKGAKLYELGDHTGALVATLGGVIPTAFRPLTEVAANMNYSGGKIYNETDWNAHLPAYRKAGYFTNPWMVEGAKALNKATGGDAVTPGRVNINPSIAEHYMMGYIGGVMTFLNQFTKTGISVFGEEDVNWNQVPVFNRFFLQDKKILQKKIDRDFRDISDEMKLIQKREGGYRKIIKEGNWVDQENAATKLDEMYESGSIDLSEAYKSAAEHIKKMRKYMEDLEDKGEKNQMEKEITDIKADFLEYKKSIDDGREEEKGKTA